MFQGFANFYYHFIWGFSKIAGPLTSILKTDSLSPSENSLNKMIENDEVVGRSNNSDQNMAESRKSKNRQILAKSKKSSHPNKSKILINLTMATNADAMGYLTPEVGKAFTRLRQAFTKYQFSNILIWNVISGLKLIYQISLMAEYFVSWILIR